MGTTDKMKNKAQGVQGKVTEKVGEWTDDPEMRDKGRREQAKAQAKGAGEKLKDAGHKVADALGDAADALRK